MIKKAVVLSLLFFLMTSPASAQTAASTVSLTSCAPNAIVAEDNSFVTESGDAVVFSCTLTNTGTAEATVLLSGERAKDAATGSTPPASVAFAVVVPPQKAVEADVPFIALFENGTYRYTITLKNISDGTSFGTALTFSSTLDAPTIRIVSAALDTDAYASEDVVSLLVTVATSTEGAEEPFFLDAVVKEKDGTECSYVVSSRPITSSREGVSFSLSALPGGCSAASLGIILKSRDGFPQDSRDIPLVVRGLNVSTTQLILAVLVIGALFGLAWAFRTLRRRRANTPTISL